MDQKHHIFGWKFKKFHRFFIIFRSHKIDTPVCEFNFWCPIWRAEIKIWFPVTWPKIFKECIKNNVFFLSKYVIFHHFRSEKSTRRYVNSIFDVRYGLREKAPRVGFEPTRDFSRPFQGMRQWWLPLRHGRGCGLRGSGSRWCAAGRCRKSMIFRRNWSSKNQHAGCAMGQKPREKHPKIDHFSSKLSVKKSTRWFCNYAQLQLRTRSFRI